jgi:2-succinyl-5-enolpyruvyl-6-hydroxy-3-cyclohexene-1-carboxylate synthase
LLSRSFGINYHTVNNADEMQGLLARLDYKKSINLIEIMIDKDVFPGYVSRR